MSQATRILAALIAGIALGIGAAALHGNWAAMGIMIFQPIGTAWLNGLQMTIVPLVIALLVLGVAATADAARAGLIATRSMILFIAILWASSILAALLTPLLLKLWPLAPGAASALKAA